jgi:hypothetical protein
MRASFVDLRLTPGELLCGAAHDILTRSALVRVATWPHVTAAGRNARSTAGGRRVAFLGRTQANANVNYGSPANSVLQSLISAKTLSTRWSPPPSNRTQYLALSFETRSNIYLVAFPVTCGRCGNGVSSCFVVRCVPCFSGDRLNGL